MPRSHKSKLLLTVSALVIGSGLLISFMLSQRYSRSLFEALTTQAKNTAQVVSLEAVDKILADNQMALDKMPVDNSFFRELQRKNSGVYIVGLSNRPFHPELEEAMSRHISSCLTKPVDIEELVYWI